MKKELEIPEKKNYSWILAFSGAITFVGLCALISNIIGLRTDLSDSANNIRVSTVFLLMCLFFPVILLVRLNNLRKYYDPKFRTLIITSPEQLIKYANAETLFSVYKFKAIQLVLQADHNATEKFYLDLRFNQNSSGDLFKSINSFEAKYGTLLAVSFILNYSKEESGPGSPQSVSMKLLGKHEAGDPFYLGSLVSDNPFDSYLKE